ncbi:MAG: formylmethanofuran dehydrogenase subunit E family protein [Rhodomicrobium sp.]
MRWQASFLIAFSLFMGVVPVYAETPEEWIRLGARVHGGFGSFIPVGIRIGLDALDRLKAKPREVTVTYYDSDKAPCACIADGVSIATVATVGQRTLILSPEKAPVGAIAMIIIRNKITQEALKYTVSESWLPKLAEINKRFEPEGRYEEVMKADGLFHAVPFTGQALPLRLGPGILLNQIQRHRPEGDAL